MRGNVRLLLAAGCGSRFRVSLQRGELWLALVYLSQLGKSDCPVARRKDQCARANATRGVFPGFESSELPGHRSIRGSHGLRLHRKERSRPVARNRSFVPEHEYDFH